MPTRRLDTQPQPNGVSALFDELMLPDQAVLQRTDADAPRAVLPIRLPWYRSLQLSTIDGIELAVDGETVSADDVSINFGGAKYSLAEAAQLPDAWWFVLDTLQTEIPVPASVEPGDHRVDLTLSLRIPYATPDRHRTFPHFMQTAVGTRTVSFIGKDL
jgi:hypothetical protein